MSKTTSSSSSTTASDLHFPVERDGKAPTAVSNTEFLVTAGLVVPLLVTVVLPLTVVYQLGKGLSKLVLPNNTPEELPTIDSGYQLSKEDTIVPRPQRKYDVVLLGATGFTGRLGARHLAKTYGVDKEVKWAIAGRSQKKLEDVKQSLAKELGNDEILQLDTIVVDTTVASTLPNLVRDTRAVVTTAGPFSQYGNFVVEFCAKFGTHYTDITGESAWVKTMIVQWQETAKQTGAKIISLCGNDCVPWDLTVDQLAKKLQEEANEDLVSVTCTDEFVGSASGGTYQTMKLVIDGKLPAEPTMDPFRNTASGTVHSEGVQNKIPGFIFKSEMPWNGKTGYGSPFIMSGLNIQTVGWTQALRGGAALTYSEHQISPDFRSAFVSYFSVIAFFTALMNPLTSSLLDKFVLPKPGEGPSMKDMLEKNYLSIYAQGVGNKGTQVEAVMYFPNCAGYLDTARMVVESGLSLALEEDKLPTKGGGFFSPAYGLGNVLLKRLTDTGTYFSARLKESK